MSTTHGSTLLATALVAGLLAAPIRAQRVEVGVGLAPSIGPPLLRLDDARVATVLIVMAKPGPRTSVEVGAVGIQGHTSPYLNGDVAMGGSRRVGAALIGVRQTTAGSGVQPYVRVGVGLAVQSGQAGGRPVGRIGAGLSLTAMPAYLEVGALATSCTTSARSEKTCSYIPVIIGWRF